METKIQEIKQRILDIDMLYHSDESKDKNTQEVLKAYRELLKSINDDPELVGDEVELLVMNITDKIDRIIHPRHPRYNEDLITTEEEFRAAIEEIHNNQRYGNENNEMLTDGEAIKLYNILLDVLRKMKDLSPEVERDLRRTIMLKIGQASKVEKEKEQELIDLKNKKDDAFAIAKARFKALSILEKIKSYRLKENPKAQDIEELSIEEIDNLYQRKR